ncbi:1-acyl-sn-glycerol-3-phosphate acyltransferase [uncultured Capnocytophaga sp.]|uniref:1-acyl-sn-glycerol-3-phosphate acyltransferase n=1 Tax=uncultured Capnocytophaga sp. TaxID=159273 RepID=UPI002612C752|nr:1-acyl-sn-glycerol-3-phosphate acyltransferase [uncultured Capnocytophaga sp.]
MTDFSQIRPFHDSEVSEILNYIKDNPTIHQLLQFGFPKLSEQEQMKLFLSCKKIRDFQSRIMYPIIKSAINKSVTQLSDEGFEYLNPSQSYLFISNHRDIILDTSFLNVLLHEKGFKMTASAMGSNLVNTPFLLAFAKLNRNFIIHRGLSPRETLQKSQLVSKFIARCVIEKNRSVWIAQREGRTKDGDDRTQQGVIKMLSMNCPNNMSLMNYFKQLHIVPMAISYEFDPTDILKIPALLAQHHGVEYVKKENEDYNNIVQGLVGQKGCVHISVGRPLYEELDVIAEQEEHTNRQIQTLVELMDNRIHSQYKLFASNYIAYDLLNDMERFSDKYTEKELRQFERRLENRSNSEGNISRKKFLEMYANPVINKLKL